jgi:predicted alpha/beta hydrolase
MADGRETDFAGESGLSIATVAFEASDGFPLKGRLFSGSGEGPVVLVASATAVPQGYYAKFAAFLVADRGFRAALTFDYRGMGRSPAPRGWKGRLNYRDWGLFDLPAATGFLDRAFPGHAMVGIGHSYGGQGFGISGTSERFARFALVASQLAYWRLMDEPYKILLSMNTVGVPLSLALGRVPGWMGIGEDMPGSVYRDWARWCRSRNYMFDDRSVDARARYRTVTTPLLLVGLEDDPWATRRASAALLERYENAPRRERWFSPKEAGGKIGHIGFFRSRFRENLWPEVAGWLRDG